MYLIPTASSPDICPNKLFVGIQRAKCTLLQLELGSPLRSPNYETILEVTSPASSWRQCRIGQLVFWVDVVKLPSIAYLLGSFLFTDPTCRRTPICLAVG
ncbi:unnamed protein product [Dibothriocephalus latus]|uniref:Uncharacterized protein n=1 Tax=Dibothriocephalus latus TaxID=60516 RepID=A0A3P7R8X8_DIBLA|nr:unnamed protein product [Dibothriocephalus latus]